ncbi:hypothetical protein KJ785_01230 [Patescibacteria group bacterium]|nr:hypothetical protein [Patescibacteria group bacterium]
MNLLEKYNLKLPTVLKVVGLAIVGILIIAFAFLMVGSSFKSVLRMDGSESSYSINDSVNTASRMESAGSVMGLSVRNVISSPSPILPPGGEITTGDNAEEFEVTEYNASIETRQLDQTCAKVAELKTKDYVIFENASEYDKGCSYVFKVKKDNVEEILNVIKEMNPKDLQENTYTIKKLVDDFTSEIEILEKKLASIDDTLNKAVTAYDEVAVLSTKIQNVETLTKIINSKIDIIERLTQARININSQLEQISRSKAEQLDRLEYTYFRINIWENKFVDGKNIIDSWKMAVKNFVSDTNRVIQDITINLLVSLFLLLQYIIYLFILLVTAKYGWKLVKYIWRK